MKIGRTLDPKTLIMETVRFILNFRLLKPKIKKNPYNRSCRFLYASPYFAVETLVALAENGSLVLPILLSLALFL